jgi:hypothetical protein
MMVAILVIVYLAVLIVGSVVFHRRYGCAVAACLTGFIAAFLTTSGFVAFVERSRSPSEYIGTFWWGGVSLWIVSSILSCFIGLPFQRKVQTTKVYPAWLFWILSFTFVWGYFVATLGVRKFFGWSQWAALLGYPIICWAAAVLLARAKRSGSTFFSVVHALFGVAWIIYVLWVYRAFARSFWK